MHHTFLAGAPVQQCSPEPFIDSVYPYDTMISAVLIKTEPRVPENLLLFSSDSILTSAFALVTLLSHIDVSDHRNAALFSFTNFAFK